MLVTYVHVFDQYLALTFYYATEIFMPYTELGCVIVPQVISWGYPQTLILNEGNTIGSILEIYRVSFVCHNDWKVQLTRDAILAEMHKVIPHNSSCLGVSYDFGKLHSTFM